MASSKATTVKDYLAELPAERRAVVSAVRDVVVGHLPEGYVEGMNWGMITYEVPLARYPDTYNGRPLAYAALAAQGSFYALYLTCVYGVAEREAWLKDAFAKAGKKLDMGKSCLRFKRLEDLPLDVIGRAIAQVPVEEFIAGYEATRAAATAGRAAEAAGKKAKPKPAAKLARTPAKRSASAKSKKPARG